MKNGCIFSELLRYHIIEHNLCSAAVLGRARLPTLEGQKINLTCGTDDLLHVNGKAVSQADIMATNGVIHVLDDILIPDSGRAILLFFSSLLFQRIVCNCFNWRFLCTTAKTLHEVLMEQEQFEFLEYAQQAGVSDILKGERYGGNFTVFVPSVDYLQSNAHFSTPKFYHL